MKKFVLVCTLIAALAAAGCGDNETSKKASVPSSSSTAKQEVQSDKNSKDTKTERKGSEDFVMTENVKKTLQEKNVTIVKQSLSSTKNRLITDFSDGSFVMDKISEAPKFSESTGAKLGHFHK